MRMSKGTICYLYPCRFDLWPQSATANNTAWTGKCTGAAVLLQNGGF